MTIQSRESREISNGIIGLQARVREIGRIRMGKKVPTQNGGSRPAKLDTFRLTCSDRALLECAAALYGGKVEAWPDMPGQWQVTIEAEELPFLITPQPISQAMELWSGGGCVRRCNGQWNQIGDCPCECPVEPDERMELAKNGKACKPTTRFSVMLPQLPGLGVFRLETHGYYAATELGPTAELLLAQAKKGNYIEAYLAIEQRKKVSGGETKVFPVPVIRIRQTLQDVLSGAAGVSAPKLNGHSDGNGNGNGNGHEIAAPSRQIESGTRGVPSEERPVDRPLPKPSTASPAASPTVSSVGVDDVWPGPGQCPNCHAPEGKRHGMRCVNTVAKPAAARSPKSAAIAAQTDSAPEPGSMAETLLRTEGPEWDKAWNEMLAVFDDMDIHKSDDARLDVMGEVLTAVQRRFQKAAPTITVEEDTPLTVQALITIKDNVRQVLDGQEKAATGSQREADGMLDGLAAANDELAGIGREVETGVL
jgi:hypothetical protein